MAYLNNKTDQDYLNEKTQIINATENDIKSLVAYIEAICSQNNICVIGNDKKLEDGKDIFKELKPLLK